MAEFRPHSEASMRHDVGVLAAGGVPEMSDGSFAWMGGRRFLAHAPYLLPCDDLEFNRQDFEHYVLRQAFRSNVLAPVNQPMAILDVGIGTGRWAIEVAGQFPNARVVGADLFYPASLAHLAQAQSGQGIGANNMSPAMSNFSFVPANVLSPLPFPDGSFDYVHMRFLSAAIPLARWRQVLYELARTTRRGGWIEVVDTSWTPLHGGPATERLFYWARVAGLVHEINLQLAAWIGSLFLDSGLGNVTAPKMQLPMGRAAGRIGSMVAANALAVAEAIQPWVLGYSIATAEEYAATLGGVRTEITDGACAYPIYAAFGQRI